MNRLTGSAALAAVLLSLALTGCGGSSAAADTTSTTQSISGISTPTSVSVVTAKNAD